MILESLDKHDQEEVTGAPVSGEQATPKSEVAQGSEVSEGIGANRSESEVAGSSQQPIANSQQQDAGGGVRVPLIGAGGAGAGAGGQEAVGTQGGGLPTKSMGVVDWAKVIDGYRQSQRAEQTGAKQSEGVGV